jgi:Brp/Blh family beta-carotene 15,15'-monooxygenase
MNLKEGTANKSIGTQVKTGIIDFSLFKYSIRNLVLIGIIGLLILLNSNPELQWNIGLVVTITGLIAIGIPHGAVDYLIETGTWNFQSSPTFILRYIVSAAAMGVLWYFAPQPAIYLFLGYSVWHFGQADGVAWKFSIVESIIWGISVLFFILGTHHQETNSILASMGNQFPLPECPFYALIPWMIWSLYKRNYSLLITTIWITLTTQIPLLFAFGFYFVGQHSWVSWAHLQAKLKMSNRKIWLKSLPLQIGAWILLGLFFKIWSPVIADHPAATWGTFFIFVGCVSFPHVLAMNKLYFRKAVA